MAHSWTYPPFWENLGQQRHNSPSELNRTTTHLGLHQSRQVFHFRFNALSREGGVYRLILLSSIDQEQSSLNGTDSHNELLQGAQKSDIDFCTFSTPFQIFSGCISSLRRRRRRIRPNCQQSRQSITPLTPSRRGQQAQKYNSITFSE